MRIYYMALVALMALSGCNSESGSDGNITYSPQVRVSAIRYLRDINLSMDEINATAEAINGVGEYQFYHIPDFHAMRTQGGILADNSDLEYAKAQVVCDSNYTTNMAINVLIPELSTPEPKGMEFPYVNVNIFTTMLSYISTEELASRYPNSAAMNSDFNYDAYLAAITRYSGDIDIIGGSNAREARFEEFCKAAEQLVEDKKVPLSYSVRVSSLHRIKEANVTMEGLQAHYKERAYYQFDNVDSIGALEVSGGSFITNDDNESDYNASLIVACPDINSSQMVMLQAPVVDTSSKVPYLFVNPFTTLLAQGKTAEELNATYPIAYAIENDFNFDTAYTRANREDTNESNFTKELCEALAEISK